MSPEICKRQKNANIVFTSSKLIPNFNNSCNWLRGYSGQVKYDFNNMDNWKRNFARFYLPAKKNIKFLHLVFNINRTDYYRY